MEILFYIGAGLIYLLFRALKSQQKNESSDQEYSEPEEDYFEFEKESEEELEEPEPPYHEEQSLTRNPKQEKHDFNYENPDHTLEKPNNPYSKYNQMVYSPQEMQSKIKNEDKPEEIKPKKVIEDVSYQKKVKKAKFNFKSIDLKRSILLKEILGPPRAAQLFPKINNKIR